jgi:hypothetical protein
MKSLCLVSVILMITLSSCSFLFNANLSTTQLKENEKKEIYIVRPEAGDRQIYISLKNPPLSDRYGNYFVKILDKYNNVIASDETSLDDLFIARLVEFDSTTQYVLEDKPLDSMKFQFVWTITFLDKVSSFGEGLTAEIWRYEYLTEQPCYSKRIKPLFKDVLVVR